MLQYWYCLVKVIIVFECVILPKSNCSPSEKLITWTWNRRKDPRDLQYHACPFLPLPRSAPPLFTASDRPLVPVGTVAKERLVSPCIYPGPTTLAVSQNSAQRTRSVLVELAKVSFQSAFRNCQAIVGLAFRRNKGWFTPPILSPSPPFFFLSLLMIPPFLTGAKDFFQKAQCLWGRGRERERKRLAASRSLFEPRWKCSPWYFQLSFSNEIRITSLKRDRVSSASWNHTGNSETVFGLKMVLPIFWISFFFFFN